MHLFTTSALPKGASGSPASRHAVKVGSITHPLPGEVGLRVGLCEFKAWQRQGAGTSSRPSKWHRSSVNMSSEFIMMPCLGSLSYLQKCGVGISDQVTNSVGL